MSSSRFFIYKDSNPQSTTSVNPLWFAYCVRLNSNPELAKKVNAYEGTKSEAMTIGKIFAYIKQGSAKVK
ncbi:hypothetical protein YC2023_113929 [Brassica napus]